MLFTKKYILRVAGPILVSLLMEHLIGMTDTAFLGRVGEIELGASAIAGIYYLAIFMLGFGFSIGVQILIGRRNGEKKLCGYRTYFHAGIAIPTYLSSPSFRNVTLGISYYFKIHFTIRTYIRSYIKISRLARLRLLFFFHSIYVPGILCRNC